MTHRRPPCRDGWCKQHRSTQARLFCICHFHPRAYRRRTCHSSGGTVRISNAGGGNLTGEVQSLRSATQPSPRFRRQLSLSRLTVVSRQIETDHTRSASRSVDGSPPGCGTDPPCDARLDRLAGHDATTMRSLLRRAVATDNAKQVCVRAPFSTAFGQFRTPTCADSGNSCVRLIRYGMCEERRAIRRMESRRPHRIPGSTCGGQS